MSFLSSIEASGWLAACSDFGVQRKSVLAAQRLGARYGDRDQPATYIYALRDPTAVDLYGHPDGAIFYIGLSRKPSRRLSTHHRVTLSRGFALAKEHRLATLLQGGHSVRMELLNRVPSRRSLRAEHLWMLYCSSLGYALTNSGIRRLPTDFRHVITPDPLAECSTLGDLALHGGTIMLQCLDCSHLMWRDPAALLVGRFGPELTVTQYRTFQHGCEACGSGAIVAGIEEKGEAA